MSQRCVSFGYVNKLKVFHADPGRRLALEQRPLW
jgi:hypothetical protein